MTKTLAFFAALSLASLGSSFAQTRPAPAGAAASPAVRADRQAQYFSKQLGLSADQEARMESILLAQSQELQTLKEKYPAGSRRGLGAALKEGQARYDEQLRAVLTPEQFAKYSQLREERREKMRDHRAAQ